MKRVIQLPYKSEDLKGIKKGDEVILNGVLYVGRDQVHKRLFDLIQSNQALPIAFPGNAIYYMGPSPAPEGFVIGAAGPTTSARMDPFSPLLISKGLRVMVGKGPRSEAVYSALKEYGGLYLQAYGGCGALYSSCIRSKEVIAWSELGPEALLKLTVENFPTYCLFAECN